LQHAVVVAHLLAVVAHLLAVAVAVAVACRLMVDRPLNMTALGQLNSRALMVRSGVNAL